MPTAPGEDATLHYEVHGSGPALVFAHGAGGNTLSWWQQVPWFAERHTVVTFDHRGFGRSRCGADAFRPARFAADLFAILDAAGIERAVLACQSMGGWTGLRAATARPERVRGLFLSGTPGGLAPPGVRQAAARMGAGLAEEGIRGNAALAPDFPKREPALAHLYERINGLNDAFEPRLLARLFEPEALLAPEALAGYAVPTRMVCGAQDQLFPPEALREAAELIPGASLEVLPGSGHSPYFEEAPAWNALLDAFLATLRG